MLASSYVEPSFKKTGWKRGPRPISSGSPAIAFPRPGKNPIRQLKTRPGQGLCERDTEKAPADSRGGNKASTGARKVGGRVVRKSGNDSLSGMDRGLVGKEKQVSAGRKPREAREPFPITIGGAAAPARAETVQSHS